MTTSKAAALLHDLADYAPADLTEGQAHLFISVFLETEAEPFSRETLHGHITSSAFVVDSTYTNVLLVWHRKLLRWLQPGGHVEADDASVYDSAIREAVEETGHEVTASALGTRVFDVDVHDIPARKDEPAHQHLDVRYLFVVGDKVTEADHELRWMRIEDVAADPSADPSTVRAVGKIAKLRESIYK